MQKYERGDTEWKDYTIRAAPLLYSSYFYPLPIYIPIATSRNEPESNPQCSGLPTLMSPAKPLLPARLTESTEFLAIDLAYVLQAGMYQIFALVPNSGRNIVFVFGRIVSSERIRIVSL